MTNPKWSYDVFLSFRGEDTRYNFISFLHHALKKANIKTFIDDKLRRGDTISSSLVQAIETSMIAIVVFSPNFASSTWCLDELVNILRCKHSRGQLVRPVFYHVDPSTMRKQTGLFEPIFAKLEENFGDNLQKVDGWRSALTEAANLAGWHIGGNVYEAEIVQKIVEEVSSKLRRSELIVALHPVGLEAHIQAINMLLNVDNDKVQMVVIYGIGGIGKTTIAKAVYNQLADQFEGSSFVADIRETSRQYGLMKLQEALLHDALGDTSIKVGYVNAGMKLVRDRLQGKRILCILDDVDHLEQVEKLTGWGEWFSSRSRIIITTRDEKILVAKDAEVYKVPPLNYSDAIQLFSFNAFEKSSPKADYELMAFPLTNYAKGHPLALKVLGSFLNGKTRQEWNQALKSLEKLPQGEDKILKISFDGLEDNEKDIFLDIACFFNGKEVSKVTKMLDRCNFYPENGLKILAKRSLIYIESNKIWMHDLIQEFGREIVHQESPENPGRRSRLWYHEDVMQVLKENSGTNAIQGINLDLIEPEEILMRTTAITKMTKLRVIMLGGMHISGCPGYLSIHLEWLGLGRENLPNLRLGCGKMQVDDIKPEGSGDTQVDDIESEGSGDTQVDDIKPDHGIVELSAKPALGKLRMKFGNIFKKINAAFSCFRHEMAESPHFHGCTEHIIGDQFYQLPVFSRSAFRPSVAASEDSDSDNEILGFRRFSLGVLCHVTENFSEVWKISFGSFGYVYHAILYNASEVAIKRAWKESTHSTFRERAFRAEIDILGGLEHENLVRLIGSCEEADERILVYDYMKNGSLDKHLHNIESSALLCWTMRLRLALEVASGIEYLHCGTPIPVIHGDIKTSNILLDSNWTAKISDFGLSRFATNNDDGESDISLPGTQGYLDPEFFPTGTLTTKSDVFGFGVILLELLSGRRAFHWDEHGIRRHVVEAIVPFIAQGAITNVLDKSMSEPTVAEMEAVLEMGSLAAECVELEPQKRPTMTEVVRRLTQALNLCLPDDHVNVESTEKTINNSWIYIEEEFHKRSLSV